MLHKKVKLMTAHQDDRELGTLGGLPMPDYLDLLQIAWRHKSLVELGIVVNAILESYKAFLDETYRNMTDDTVKLIKEARDVLNNDLAKQEAAYREFREKSPMIWKGKEEINPRQDRLAIIESQRTA